jgi:hypothetical protein
MAEFNRPLPSFFLHNSKPISWGTVADIFLLTTENISCFFKRTTDH